MWPTLLLSATRTVLTFGRQKSTMIVQFATKAKQTADSVLTQIGPASLRPPAQHPRQSVNCRYGNTRTKHPGRSCWSSLNPLSAMPWKSTHIFFSSYTVATARPTSSTCWLWMLMFSQTHMVSLIWFEARLPRGMFHPIRTCVLCLRACLDSKSQNGRRKWQYASAILFADIKFRHKIKNKTGESFKSGRFRLPRGRTGDGFQKREPPAQTGRLNRSGATWSALR